MGWLFTPAPEELDRGYEADTELPEVVIAGVVTVGVKRSRETIKKEVNVAMKKRVGGGRIGAGGL